MNLTIRPLTPDLWHAFERLLGSVARTLEQPVEESTNHRFLSGGAGPPAAARYDRISDASADQELAEPKVRMRSPPAKSLQAFGS